MNKDHFGVGITAAAVMRELTILLVTEQPQGMRARMGQSHATSCRAAAQDQEQEGLQVDNQGSSRPYPNGTSGEDLRGFSHDCQGL